LAEWARNYYKSTLAEDSLHWFYLYGTLLTVGFFVSIAAFTFGYDVGSFGGVQVIPCMFPVMVV